MMGGPKKQRNDKQSEQSRLFKEKAREVGADQSGDDDEIMRRLAEQKRGAASEKKKPGR